MSDTTQTQPAKTRYYAIHANAEIDLHGWDDQYIAAHRQKDFSARSYVHVVDRLIDCCAVCGEPTYAIRAGAGQFCPGPRNTIGIARGSAPQAPVAGGIVGDANARKSLQDMIEKYKAMPPPAPVMPDDCHTGTEGGGTVPKQEEAPKKDVLIAESAKPTTGIDWDAFKNFGKGL